MNTLDILNRGGRNLATTADGAAAESKFTQVSRWIEDALAEHRRILIALPRLLQLAGEAADGNRDEPQCVALRSKSEQLCERLGQQFDREERALFSMFLQLRQQTIIRPCKAGVISAWVGQTIREQNELIAQLKELLCLSKARMAPAGPCESCREMVQVAEEIGDWVLMHSDWEQRDLFRWAVDLEAELVRCGTEIG